MLKEISNFLMNEKLSRELQIHQSPLALFNCLLFFITFDL